MTTYDYRTAAEKKPPPYTDETAEQFVKDLKQGLAGTPWLEVGISRLSGKGRHSIILRLSLDDKKDWSNGILQNSRYGFFNVGNDGKLELFAIGGTNHPFKRLPKMRKSPFKDAKQVVTKIKAWMAKADKEVPAQT